MCGNYHRVRRGRGLSLLEILAAVVLLGIVAVIALPRMSGSSDKAKANACLVNQGNIELQAQLWFRNKGVWPAANLGDIFGNSQYFPGGALTCPVDGSAYQFNSTTMEVVGHTHADLL